MYTQCVCDDDDDDNDDVEDICRQRERESYFLLSMAFLEGLGVRGSTKRHKMNAFIKKVKKKMSVCVCVYVCCRVCDV